MKSFVPLTSRSLNTLLAGLVLALVVILALAAWLTPAPKLTIAYQDSVVEVVADRAWVLLPGDCARIRWEFDSVFPIHIDGVEWRESGEQRFCPQVFSPSPKIELTDHRQGVYLNPRLDIFYLPDVVANVLALAALGFFPLMAAYYLWTNSLDKRPPLRTIFLAMLALCLCLAVLQLTGLPITIVGTLAFLRSVFVNPHWQLLGGFLSGVLYIPLAFHALWHGLKKRQIADFVAFTGFLLIVVALYIPFGFASVGQWDEWTFYAVLENMSWLQLYKELTSRPLMLAPSFIAYSISAESFIGFNLVYALLLWARPVMLYRIYRHLNVRHLYAFLATMIFLGYPVDARLMSLQSIMSQFSFVALLTAIYLLLRYVANPTRPILIGIWLALGLCVGVYESAYALIAVLPLLWWYRIRNKVWHNLNLTFIWYVVPASKVVYIMFLLSAGRSFYQSDFIYSGSEISLSDLFSQMVGRLFEVYQRSFAFGWIEAVQSIKHNSWIPLMLLLLVALAVLAWLIWRTDKHVRVPEIRNLGLTLVTGLLLILPSVAVLIWIDYYNNELRGLYLYIPVAGAIVLFCLIVLLASLIVNSKYQNVVITAMCLFLMLPGLSRLYLQHEYYVTSANNKARILAQIAQMAPAIGNETRILVVSDMTDEEFRDKNIEAFTSSALGHALYVVYGGQGSGRGSICPSIESCFPLKNRTEFLVDTIVFRMDRELNLELISEPQIIYEEFIELDYHVSRLFDDEAPIPTRAYSMLGLSKE